MRLSSNALSIAFTAAIVLSAMPNSHATTIKAYTQGHGQLSGANGEFGVVYTFQSHWNEEILAAAYSPGPVTCYMGWVSPKAGQKLLILAIAIKNPQSTSQWFNDEMTDSIVAVDQNGTQYPINAYEQQSSGNKGIANATLNPGQGMGQPALHNPLWAVGPIDGKARIEKIIINCGRLDHPSEKVLRYYMSTATAAEDGANGDPRNVIKPLPAGMRDPSDPTGATALNPGNGGKPGAGTPCPSNAFVLTLDAFGDAPSDFTYKNQPAPSGKKYVLATVTVTNPTGTQLSDFYLSGGSYNQLKDGDGDTFTYTDIIKKGNSDPIVSSEIQPGETRTVRYLFTMPANESATTLTLGTGGLVWTWNVGS